MTHFRKRLGENIIHEVNEWIVLEKEQSQNSSDEYSGLTCLNKRQYKQLLVIHELYRQQSEIYAKQSHRIEDRIVSIHQPHVRPIVRGKAKASVEFGAKVAISLVNGYALIEKLQ